MATTARPVLIRLAEPSDVPSLLLIQQWTQAIDWSEASFLSAIEKQQVVVAKAGQALVGFIIVSAVLDEAELLYIAVSPDYQRQGIAQQLWFYRLPDLRQKAIRYCFLEVAKGNHPAVNLYRKLGFESIAERKNYYHNDDAIIMRADL